ncbi:MAG: glycosyl transferase family 2 [Haloferacaceae archaeon]
MEYGQERVTTLHDLGNADPPAPTGEAAVVVPMTERDYGATATERVFTELAALDPAQVVVALRAPAERVGPIHDWLDGFSLPLTTCWCGGPRVTERLAEAGLDGPGGKGRDLWVGLGAALATDAPYVVVHDVDAEGFRRRTVRRLLYPLFRGHEFSKGYYARVESPAPGEPRQLYGRLNRLFYEPLVEALADRHDARDHPLLAYLGAFRYALAGEFAATREFAAGLPLDRGWGLEVGVLASAFEHAGFAGTAQVDLGTHEHGHRSVSGAGGLASMSADVGGRLLRAVRSHGVEIDHAALRARYHETAARYVDAYATDAGFNGLTYDREREKEQVAAYAEAVAPPTDAPPRLPAWRAAPLAPETVADAAAADLADVVTVDAGEVSE